MDAPFWRLQYPLIRPRQRIALLFGLPRHARLSLVDQADMADRH
jgi:hypothetical protein